MFHSVFELRDPIANRVLRSRVSKLVELVNNAHGWTIIGWVRTGRVKDASEEGNNYAMDIASEDLKPHIVYLQPTDPKDLDEISSDEYKELLITEEGFIAEMKKEEDELKQEQRKRSRSPE